jgi:hypothetical protein
MFILDGNDSSMLEMLFFVVSTSHIKQHPQQQLNLLFWFVVNQEISNGFFR